MHQYKFNQIKIKVFETKLQYFKYCYQFKIKLFSVQKFSKERVRYQLIPITNYYIRELFKEKSVCFLMTNRNSGVRIHFREMVPRFIHARQGENVRHLPREHRRFLSPLLCILLINSSTNSAANQHRFV